MSLFQHKIMLLLTRDVSQGDNGTRLCVYFRNSITMNYWAKENNNVILNKV